jgi:hypothetical protein
VFGAESVAEYENQDRIRCQRSICSKVVVLQKNAINEYVEKPLSTENIHLPNRDFFEVPTMAVFSSRLDY